MSHTIKIATIQHAEDYINRQNREIENLRVQLSNSERESRLAAEQEVTSRIKAERQATIDRLNQEINHLQTDIQKNIDEEKRARIALDLERKQWTLQLVKNLEQNVNSQIKSQQVQINNIEKSLEGLFQKEIDEEKKANRLLTLAKDEAERIQNETLHDKYASGELKQIETKLNEGVILAGDNPSSKQGTIINAITDLRILEEKITKEEFKFGEIYKSVLTEASGLLKEMEKNKYYYPTNENGKRYKDKNNNDIKWEVNFWSNGKYSNLEEEAKKLRKELIANKNKVELDEKRLEIIKNRISEIKQAKNQLVIDTRIKGFASQQRFQICYKIINAMRDQCWNPGLCHYENGDQREKVKAILENRDWVVDFTINTDENNCTQVSFKQNEKKQKTEKEFRKSINEIRKILKRDAQIDFPAPKDDQRKNELVDPIALKYSETSKAKQIKFS